VTPTESDEDIAALKKQLINIFDEKAEKKPTQKVEDAARSLVKQCISAKPLELSPIRIAFYQKLGLFSPSVTLATMQTIIASTLDLNSEERVVLKK
jgi:hypothetical protein